MGRAGDVKKIHAGKIERKKSCTARSPEKMFLHAEKNISAREMLTKKIHTARKFPTPTPHNFSNGPT